MEQGAAAREALRTAAKEAGAGNKVVVFSSLLHPGLDDTNNTGAIARMPSTMSTLNMSHGTACHNIMYLQPASGHIPGARSCRSFQLPTCEALPGLCETTAAVCAQIRRQRIRDAAAAKSQWRAKVEALRKEEAALQPEVDKLSSASFISERLQNSI